MVWNLRVRRSSNRRPPAATRPPARSRRIVFERLREAEDRIKAGAPVKDASRTVREWCWQWIDTSLEASEWRASTRAGYRTALTTTHRTAHRRYSFYRLAATDVEKWIVGLRDRGLKSSSINKYFQALRLAIDYAVRDGVLGRNVVREDVREPKVTRSRKPPLSDDETRQLYAALAGTRHLRLVQLIVTTGLRESEALGLKWEDLDIEHGVLAVRRSLSRVRDEMGILLGAEPKTSGSARTLPLDPTTVALINAQRASQLEDRTKAGSAWIETGHVFTTASGRPIDQRNLLRAVHNAAAKAGLRSPGRRRLTSIR